MNLQKIKEWILNNILTILTIVVPGVGSIYATIAGHISGKLTLLDFALILALLIILITLAIKTAWNKISFKSYRYPWLKIRTAYNYIVTEKTITYKRNANDILRFSRTMKIKCCSNRINYALDKYIWTGIQPNQVEIKPTEGIAHIREKSRIGIWRYIVLELDNHMGKGDKKTLSYEWPDIPQCSKSSPFFSTSTDEPTQKIFLKLELGEEYANQEIICEEFRAIESDYPIYTEKRNLDERGSYTWEISPYKIKRFRHYRIRWSWKKGQPAAEII